MPSAGDTIRPWLARLLVLGVCGPLAAQAGPRWIDSWERCVASAKVDGKPIFLLVSGRQWDPGSRSFEQKVLADSDVLRLVATAYLPFRIEVPVREERRPAATIDQERSVLRQLAFYGHQGLPRVVLLDPSLRVYGRTGPVGTAADFVESLAAWEAARKATLAPTVDAAAATRHIADANASRTLKNPAKATSQAKLATQADPRLALAHFTLGLALQELEKYEDATRSYFAALAIDSTGSPAEATTTIWAAGSWFNLAGIARQRAQEAKAIFYLRENQRTDHRTDAPMLRIAELHANAGRAELGLEDYGELLSRDGLSPTWLRSYLTLQDVTWKGK